MSAVKELLDHSPELLISVIGVGGCGCNTVNMLNEQDFSSSVKLIAVNTDLAVLNHSEVATKILIGENLTNGYGAGADPAVGLKAAQESEEALRNAIKNSDIVIITAGFGGGTGTGASPFIANIARELGISCIAVSTLPFESESQMRMNYAMEGVEAIKDPAQAYITLSNDLLLKGLGESVGLFSAFKHSNEVLNNLLSSLVQMLTQSGYINVDINDFARIIAFEGESILGVGKAEAEEQATDAVEQALSNPLVNNVDIASAQGVIIQVVCKSEPKASTYDGILKAVNGKINHPSALIVAGVMLEPEQDCEIKILVIASGICSEEQSGSLGGKTLANDVDYLNEDLSFIQPEETLTDIPSVVRKMKALAAARERSSS